LDSAPVAPVLAVRGGLGAANLGTFIEALCFAVAALAALPRFRDPGPALRQSAA
jgi:hypothetical protein